MAGTDGSTKRNSVIQSVQNRNNIAELYLRRQIFYFQRHLALKVLTIEMEKLEWHTFLKNLKKCDSDDLSEFVPFLIEEMGQQEYTNRVKKLKTRFRDIFEALELGMDEKVQVDYVRVRENGEKAQKDHRIVKSEMRKMRVPADAELNRPRINVSSLNGYDKVTGFITNISNTPGAEQVSSKKEKGSARKVRCFGAPPTNTRMFPLLPPPPPRYEPSPPPQPSQPKSEQQQVLPRQLSKGVEEDDDVETIYLGNDSEEEEKRKSKMKKDMMRKMLDKNAKKIRRKMKDKGQTSLESRIEEFYTKIADMRAPIPNQPKVMGFPPIAVGDS